MSDDNYEVGYKKPPVGSRFKKGESGHKLGRGGKKPPPEKQAHELFDEALAKKVSVKLPNGKVVKMPRLKAGLNKLAQDFASGDKAARKTVLDYMKARGALEPPQKRESVGIAVLYRPSATAEEWASRYAGVQRPLDPLEGLPGIDADAISRTRIENRRPTPSLCDDE